MQNTDLMFLFVAQKPTAARAANTTVRTILHNIPAQIEYDDLRISARWALFRKIPCGPEVLRG